MIQVLNRALNILEYVAKDPKKAHTLSDIADHLSINQSTCANIVKTLTNRNYLEKVSNKKGYHLGSMSYFLTNNYSYKEELIDASVSPMQDLKNKTGEGCILAILRGNTRVIIHDERSDGELQVINKTKKFVYATSTGRLILSYFKEDELRHFINLYGLPTQEVWKEATTWENLQKETARIREKGLSIQQSPSHIIGIAVPILEKNKVVAALGIYMPAIRLSENVRDDLIEKLKLTGKHINENIKNIRRIGKSSSKIILS